jgi:hypothetical protein
MSSASPGERDRVESSAPASAGASPIRRAIRRVPPAPPTTARHPRALVARCSPRAVEALTVLVATGEDQNRMGASPTLRRRLSTRMSREAAISDTGHGLAGQGERADYCAGFGDRRPLRPRCARTRGRRGTRHRRNRHGTGSSRPTAPRGSAQSLGLAPPLWNGAGGSGQIAGSCGAAWGLSPRSHLPPGRAC